MIILNTDFCTFSRYILLSIENRKNMEDTKAQYSVDESISESAEYVIKSDDSFNTAQLIALSNQIQSIKIYDVTSTQAFLDDDGY